MTRRHGLAVQHLESLHNIDLLITSTEDREFIRHFLISTIRFHPQEEARINTLITRLLDKIGRAHV